MQLNWNVYRDTPPLRLNQLGLLLAQQPVLFRCIHYGFPCQM